jgi:hypothetical protein
MATYIENRFPAAVRAMAARCKLPFAIRPGLTQKIEGVWLGTPKTNAKVCRTFNAYPSTTNIKVNKRSFEVIEKGKK